jgi:D-alanyl-D-alanine carboxypeptidase
VKPETLMKLHTPAPGEPKYAMGWLVHGKPGDPTLVHAGSNTMWYALAVVAPARNQAFLVACNQANEEAANEMLRLLITENGKTAD